MTKVPILLYFIFVFADICLCDVLESSQNCIHDEISLNYKPHLEIAPIGRMLEEIFEETKKPLRIYFDTSNLVIDSANAEKIDLLKHNILPLASKYFRDILQLKRRKALLRINMELCYQAKVPEYHRVNGLETDTIIYITTTESQESYTAWATACLKDAYSGRPLGGHININLKYFDARIEYQESNLNTLLHEVTHVIGFSSQAFNTFIDPDTMEVLPKDSIVETRERGGHNTTLLKTKKLKEVVRAHFNCDSALGAELENQGGTSSLGSHFERALFMNEIMTSSRFPNRAFSKFTLAVLEDSGWYTANFKQVDQFNFGAGIGCDILENICFGAPKPNAYCYKNTSKFCSTDLTSKAICKSDFFSDGCMFLYKFSEGDCTKTENQVNGSPGESFGESSKCIIGLLSENSSEPRAYCLKLKCLNQSVEVLLSTGISIICAKEGERLEIEGTRGYIFCPKFSQICNAPVNICNQNCSLNGKCLNGRCLCKPGRSGFDCSESFNCNENKSCNGNGICMPSGYCECQDNWTGEICDIAIDPCDYLDCGVHGKCVQSICVCENCWFGPHCSELDKFCIQPDCSNNGRIINRTCQCGEGWFGENCSYPFEFCGVAPRNPLNNFLADICPRVWEEKNCETLIYDPCQKLSCGNSGRCFGGVCYCANYYQGDYCEIFSKPSEKLCQDDCNKNGECLDGTCICHYPFYSNDCSLSYEQQCIDPLCSRNGVCFGEKCICYMGYSGTNCEIEIK